MVAFFTICHIVAFVASFVILYVGFRFLWERHRRDFWVVLSSSAFILATTSTFVFGIILEN